jgi:Zn-dependent protease with chaperone function
MTASSAPQSRPTVLASTMPPWLWVWLGGFLLATMPQEISLLHFDIGTYFGHESVLLGIAGHGLITVERLSLIFDLVIYAVIVAGAVAALFPHLRGRWVEWRFRLASDDRPIMAEMQRFVSSHDPSVSLRVTIRSDQMARIYPVGWRRARIAVFRPLPALWRRDREAVEAILLHEIAHRRQGDQLIVGLGSPFVMLMRIWVPAYLLLVLIPVTIYLADGGSALAPFVVLTSITAAVLIPVEVFLPVTALWLAELSADQMAARAIGSGAVWQALRATAGPRASVAARALALLSHPPRRLRMRLAAGRPVGTAGLVAVWPAALVAWFVVLPLGLVVLALLLVGFPAGLLETGLKTATRELVPYGRPVVIATAAVLLAWPVLAYPWQRLWSAAPGTAPHQPWWPYLAAAILPIGMLLVSLAPLQGSLPASPETLPTTLPTAQQPSGFCAQVTRWELGKGLAEEEHVQTGAEQLLLGGSITAAAAQHLNSEIRAALGNPPPGAARSSYTKAMTGYRTAVSDAQAGHSTAANSALTSAANQLFQTDKLLTQVDERCISS